MRLLDVQHGFQRLFVADRVTRKFIEQQTLQLLSDTIPIPNDRLPYALHELVKVIQTAKGNREDAAPPFLAVVQKYRLSLVAPANYVLRGNESELQDHLSRTGVLLLTGISRCGKSSTARYTAAAFQRLGYEVQSGRDVEEAQRYLSDPSVQNRLYLLEDPLGSLQMGPEPTRVLGTIRWMISRLKPNRRLIVVQNSSLLAQATRTSSVSDWALESHRWIELTATTADQQASVWRVLAQSHSVEPKRLEAIAGFFRDGYLDLEFGSIAHLAANAHTLLDPLSPEQALRTAREDATSLGRALAEESGVLETLLLVLAIASTTVEPVRFEELALLISAANGDEEMKRADATGEQWWLSAAPKPEYLVKWELSSNDKHGLERLLRPRYVEALPSDWRIRFSHPYYRAAAQALFTYDTPFLTRRILAIARRGLSCASPITSRAAAHNLAWMFERAIDEETRRQIVELAVDGLSVQFPATRDRCFNFLVSNLSAIQTWIAPDSIQVWVEHVELASIDNVEWSDGEAWLPRPQGASSIWDSPYVSRLTSDFSAAKSFAADLSEGRKITAEDAARLIGYLNQYPTEVRTDVITHLLAFNDAIIRAAAAELWLTNGDLTATHVRDAIFGDSHPTVAVALLEGTVRRTRAADENSLAELLPSFLRWEISTPMAIALLPHLLLFGRSEYTGPRTPWQLFAAIFPKVLNAVPEQVRFDQARFWTVLKAAVTHLSAQLAVELCERWLQMLVHTITLGYLPGNHMLGVIEVLIRGTRTSPSFALPLLQTALGLPSTAVVATFVRDLVNDWSNLSIAERELLSSVLSRENVDRVWLHAAAITASSVPIQLEHLILGHLTLDAPPNILVDSLPSELLGACLAMQYGWPPALYAIGLAHTEGAFRAVVDEVARRPSHHLFPLAFTAVAQTGGDQGISAVILAVGPEHGERLFDILMAANVLINDFMPNSWTALLSFASDEQLSKWYQKIANAAIAVIDDISELDRWLPEKQHRDAVLSHLSDDARYIALSSSVRSSARTMNADQLMELENAFLTLLEQAPPRFHGTYTRVRNSFGAILTQLPRLAKALYEGTKATISAQEEKRSDPREQYGQLLRSWIGPA
ncbi:MAG: hypothetical protein JNK87_35170 [Bryobacterales bacterium]|nr:hypothetical protein [Bryobacterales bacterium]